LDFFMGRVFSLGEKVMHYNDGSHQLTLKKATAGGSIMKARKIFTHRDPPEAKPSREIALDIAQKEASPTRSLPNGAWTANQLCMRGVQKRNFYHALFYLQTLTLAVGTVVVAVLYGHYYVGFPSLQERDPLQIGLFLSTLLLPAIMIAIQGKEQDLPTSGCYNERAAQIQAAIFKFRTQIRPYENANAETDEAQLKANIGEIVKQLQPELMADNIPVPAGDVSEEQTQKYEEQPGNGLGGGDDPLTKLGDHSSTKEMTVGTQVRTGQYVPYAPYHDPCHARFSELPFVNPKCNDKEAGATERTPMLPSSTNGKANEAGPTTYNSAITTTKHMEMGEAEAKEEKAPSYLSSEKVEPKSKAIKIVDDGTSTLSAFDYFEIRLEPWLQAHKSYLRRLRVCQALLNMLVLIVGLSSIGAAALAKQWVVPMLIVLAAALVRIVQVSSIEDSIALIEECVSDMEAVKVWWSELRKDQQEEGSTKILLVEQSEQIMIESKTM
jgi:hypothetical protein